MTAKKPKTETASDRTQATGWIAVSLFVLGLGVLAGIYWNRSISVQEISYSGYEFVSPEELEAAAGLPTGVSPDSLDLMAAIERIEQIPYVRQADIGVEPGGNLTVYITERRPIAMLANGDEKIFVDADGVRLPLKLGRGIDLPIVYGFATRPLGDTLRSEAWLQTSDFLKNVERSAFGRATISEVAWTARDGIVALSHENGVKLLFGRHSFSDKLRNWKAFYSEIVREKGIGRMRSVDLRFQGQIVTREG